MGNLVTVTFQWDDTYGPCDECGLPAAYDVHGRYGTDPRVDRMCCRCAALAAADGATLVYLFEDEYR